MLQEVKDKYCTRVIEKLCNQLIGDYGSKSASNQDTALLNFDDNNGGTSKHNLILHPIFDKIVVKIQNFEICIN